MKALITRLQLLGRKKYLPYKGLSDIRDLMNIMSAMRGPDAPSHAHKERYTAPIRLWVLGADNYGKGGFTPHHVRLVKKLTKKHMALLVEETRMSVDHYKNHIHSALLAIQRAEGWD